MDFFYEQTHLWFLRNIFQVFHQLAFRSSINQFLEYRHLTKTIEARRLTNFTFVLQSISKWKCLIIFCYTEVLFLRHSEANRTHIFLEQAAQSVWKTFFRNIQKTISRKANVVDPNLRNISGRKCLGWNSSYFQ